jgi:hypothetical protein
MGMSSSCEAPNNVRFICVGTGSGLRILLCECVKCEDWSRCKRLGYALIELRLGVVDAHAVPGLSSMPRHLPRLGEVLVVDWSCAVWGGATVPV